MRYPFWLIHALREGRSTWRRIGLYMASITLGVAALVAINSFRGSILRSIQLESRSLLGADLELHSRADFTEPVRAVLDTAALEGTPVAYMTTVPSMAYTPASDFSRLVQFKAVDPGYPYYGVIETAPTGQWTRIHDGRNAVVDRAVSVELDLGVGDSILINEVPFAIAGVITSSPGELNFQTAVGPRVFVGHQYLAETNLIQFGSLARYQVFLQIEENQALQDFLNRYNQFFRDNEVRYDTVAERVEDLTFAVSNMTRFLALVGLTALLLGGVGVASAVNVFTREKLDTIAVLRCLGATQRTVFAAYLVQATALGFLGAVVGVAAGMGIQTVLPVALRDAFPFALEVTFDWWMALVGLGIGVWVAGIFSLLPLLTVWDVAPLRALRREFEDLPARRGVWRALAYGALIAGIVLISIWQAPTRSLGLGFSAAILTTAGALWVTARLLIVATRRFFPARARYVFRQGVANLFRPQNQTVAVVIALGFGAFLIGTIYVVQRNLLDRFQLDQRPDRPNFAAFDIQPDQRDGVVDLFRTTPDVGFQSTPIIPARLAAINGETIDDIMADTTRATRPPRWALRREYRHTYREQLADSEEIVAGDWWEDAPRSDVVRVSLEADLAADLDVGIGDQLTWTVQGSPIITEVTSLRRVDWARLDLNFFVVFEPGSLEDAPQTLIVMARIEDDGTRATLQRDLVRGYPNVSVMDLGIIQRTLDSIVGKVTLAIRFMALFSIGAGIIVLIGAVGTSRYHRMRESVLLKTLGASRRQIGQIFSTEYAALGVLAGLTGILLACGAGWGLMRFLFEIDFTLPAGPLVGLWLGVTILTVGIGLASSRKVMGRPPLAVIREINE